LRAPGRPWLTVLTYHRVDRQSARPELDPALISAEPHEFERQVEWLVRGATPISLADLLELKRGAVPAPRRSVLVTFDDGYRDFARNAWPVLRRHGVPVTLFVPTAFPGSRRCFWWDRLHAALWRTSRRESIETSAGRLPMATAEDRSRAHRALMRWIGGAHPEERMMTVELVCSALEDPEPACPLLDWNELRELAGEGVTVAPHTRTHARLDLLPLAPARREIAGSRTDLARELACEPSPAFAFPGGGYDARLVKLLAEENFELGFTTRRGPNELSRPDWLSLRRTNVGRRTGPSLLRAQLSPWAGPAVRAVAAASGR
jgi:peptidoglycan/xylan/chitin deacetylase (PgdA/CDA1 family)